MNPRALIADAPAEKRSDLTAALDVADAWRAGTATPDAVVAASGAAREAVDAVARDNRGRP